MEAISNRSPVPRHQLVTHRLEPTRESGHILLDRGGCARFIAELLSYFGEVSLQLALRWVRVIAIGVALTNGAVSLLDDVLTMEFLRHLASLGLCLSLGVECVASPAVTLDAIFPSTILTICLDVAWHGVTS